MIDTILSKTSLPNLHPALVHFPIVMLLLGVLVDIAALFFPVREWLRKTALLLSILGAVAAAVTFWSGRQAAGTVEILAQAEGPLSRHENFALYTLWFFGIYAGIRILFHFVAYRRWIHLAMVLLAVPGLALLFQTADLGGALVYKYGVGVQKIETKQPLTPATPDKAEGGKPIIDDQSITWIFAPGSEKHLTTFMKFQSGNISDIQATTEQRDSKTFLILSTSSSKPVILTFEPTLNDTQIEAEINLSEFNGQFGLIHNLNQEGYDFLIIDKHLIVLGRKTSSGEKRFSEMPFQPISGPFVFKVVGAGTHFRGYVNGKLLVHGHGQAAVQGKAGIMLEGTGKVAFVSLTVAPISEH